MSRRRRIGGRGGFVIGLVVFAGLVFLAIAIYPALFFSGSQTRSEGKAEARWKTRAVAYAGLKVASNALRTQRWWNAGPKPTPVNALWQLTGVSQRTSAQFGVDETQGRFVVVAELRYSGITELDAAGQPWIGLHHIDVFARGETPEGKVVAYGAFVASPAPPIWGASTDAFSGEPTTKRLVRVAFFPEGELQTIEQASTRDEIRDRLRTRARQYLANYAVVDLDAAPGSDVTTRLTADAATAFRDRWRRSLPGGEDPGARFLKDRLHAALYEGTPVGARPQARWFQRLDADLQDCSGSDALAVAQLFCEQDPSCEWIDPACVTPDEWDVEPEGVGPGNQTALELLEAEVGGTPDAGYPTRIQVTPPIIRSYDFGCSVTYSAALTSGEVPMPSFRNPADENRWCHEPYCNIGEPTGVVNYRIQAFDAPVDAIPDPALLYQGRVRDAVEFFRRYYSLQEGQPIPDAPVGGEFGGVFDDDDDDGPQDDGDDDDGGGSGPGDGDGDGGGGDDGDSPPPTPPPNPGTGSFGGGFSG